jgi:PPP family 3-phenylpropionic acid transporter
VSSFRIDRPTCAFWFLHFAGMGLIFPYTSLYLKENGGLSATQVGIVLAVQPLVGLLAQPGWGQISDLTGGRSRVLTLLAFGSACALAFFGQLRGFPALVCGMALLACFHQPIVPSLTAVTLAGLESGKRQWYGVVRAFGTLGFALVVLGFPPLLERIQEARGWAPPPGDPSVPGLGLLFALAGCFAFLAAWTGLLLPRKGAVATPAEPGAWRLLLRHGPYLRLLGVMFAGFFLLHGPMVFFPVFVRSLGGHLEHVALSWAWMLSLEIPFLIWAGVLAARRDPRLLLMAGLVAGGARWAGCALAPDLSWVLPMQVLHGVAVAGMITGAPLYVDAAIPGRLRSTGQGLLGLVGAGLGGAASAAVTGRVIEHFGTRSPYLVSGTGAMLLGLLVFVLLPRPTRPTRSES